jgi:hypothetical protein
MTTLDTTRPCAGGSLPPGGRSSEPPAGGEPEQCPACLAADCPCEFHRGWADGWDACAAFVAGRTGERRTAEDAS